MRRYTKLLAAAVFACTASTTFAAETIQFDPDGGGAGSAVDALTFDWSPGNALAIGGNPSGGLATGDKTQLLYQANLGIVTNENGQTTFSNGGGGSFFTAVAGFTEIATVTNGGATVNFALDPSASSFLYIYRNTTGIGDNLAGTGFTAGTAILTATLSAVTSSNFNATVDAGGNITTGTFDNVGTNNYPGITTIVGSGTTDLVWRITAADTNYFLGFDLIGSLITTSINSSLVVPFNQVNPSAAFSSNGVLNGDVAHNVGTVNGGLQNSGTDLNFQFQADGNSSFEITQRVPEPGMLALLGLGLGFLGLIRRRPLLAA